MQLELQQVNVRGRHVLAAAPVRGSRLLHRFIQWRITRHDARAKVFAAATVAAQMSGDRRAAARFQEQMHQAQAMRDGLLAQLASR